MRPASSRANPRGVALLLVIIALGAATALTSVYLASRKNSGAIGRNAGISAAAQWASRAGADLGMAALQSETDWRTHASDGILFQDHPLAGGSVTVIVTNLEGEAAQPDDREVVMTSIARVEGVYAATQRLVRLAAQVSLEDSLNAAMDEFGVYVVGGLDIGDGATLTHWPQSPRSLAASPVKVGFGSGSAAAVTIAPGAMTSGLLAVLPPSASAAQESVVSGPPFVDTWKAPVAPPALLANESGYAGLPVMSSNDLQIGGASIDGTLPPGSYQNLTVENGAVVRLADGGTYSFERVEVRTSGVLRIDGQVEALVANGLEVREYGVIEMADEHASLRLVLLGELRVRDAGVGVPREIARDAARGAMSVNAYTDPTRVRIFGRELAPDPDDPLAGGSLAYRIEENAVVVGAIHAPDALVLIETGATVIGRVTGFTLTMRSGSTLLYDPMMDNRAGFSERTGPLFTADGQPINGLADALQTYNPALGIEGLAAHVALYVDGAGFGQISPSDGWLDGSVTPRTTLLAWDATWPMRAVAIESSELTIYTLSGTLVEPKDTTLIGVLVDTTQDVLDSGGGLIRGSTELIGGGVDLLGL